MDTVTNTLEVRSDGASGLPATDVPYVELLAKSNFSFLQGASHPEELVYTAQALGYHGLGLCDNDGLYGVVRGYQAAARPSAFQDVPTELMIQQAKARGFRYLVGAEVLLLNKQSVILMPLNSAGYSRLCYLLTLAKRDIAKYHSKVSPQNFFNHCDDQLVFPLPPWDEDFLLELSREVGDRLYLPVYRDFTWQSEKFQLQAFQLERRSRLQLVATQLPLMHEPGRKPLHDALTCILHKTDIYSAENKLTLNRERYLKPLPELQQLWHDRPDLLAATRHIADRVRFSLDELKYRYPRKELPEHVTSAEFLRQKCAEGLRWRYGENPSAQAREQLQKELEIIADLHYEDYFLTLWDICQFAEEQGILYQGRGSAANSVVCYTLGLTAIDPLAFSNTFERFLSKRRGEPPDIDIDFEHERREEIIQHIYRKYGTENAAMVCTVIRYRSRLALRELAKVFDIPMETVSQWVNHMGKDGLQRLIDTPPPLENTDVDEHKFRLIVQLTRQLVGFPRHIGIHSSGFVISHNPILENVPIEKATMEGRYVVQWNKDDLDTLGMMKIDVLGLGMLSALRKCLALLREHKGIAWNLAQIPAEDGETYRMIQQADTVGVFQIESRAQMAMLPRLRPKNFYDLVIEVAIVRPGPLQGGMVHPFIRRKQGLEEVTYHHPKLEPILKKTAGVPIFQEQVLKMVQEIADFSPDEAEELRRMMSMSWYSHGNMDQLRQRLMGGMLSNGLSKEYAEQLYKMIQGFASYGFPESHAASFALLTYASSFIKCHHPEVFVCALLNSQPMGFYSARSLIGDAQKHGVVFLPLDLQKSEYDYRLEKYGEKWGVRIGLRSVYGMSEEAARRIVDERKLYGEFTNLENFLRRTQTAKKYLLKLAAADAFHSLSFTSRQAMWQIAALDLDPQSLSYTRARQVSNCPPSSAWIPTESEWEKLLREYGSKGHSLDNHPLKILRPQLAQRNLFFRRQGWVPYLSSEDILRLKDGDKIRTAGVICVHQRPPTAKGFVFLTLEDEFGMMNIVIKPPVYKEYRAVIQYRALLEIQGELEFQQGVRNIQARRVFIIDPGSLYNREVTGSKPTSTSVGQ